MKTENTNDTGEDPITKLILSHRNSSLNVSDVEAALRHRKRGISMGWIFNQAALLAIFFMRLVMNGDC